MHQSGKTMHHCGDAVLHNVVLKLEGMGFGREECIQAYLACDKSEEMAVNLLLGGF